MKYVIEFGNRGGMHVDNLIVPTRELAENLARKLVCTFTNDPNAATLRDFVFSKHTKRFIWQNRTHFVAVSKLDGMPRGSASAGLWRKPTGEELLSGIVSEHFQ